MLGAQLKLRKFSTNEVTIRPTLVLDFISNRNAIRSTIEERIKPEGAKAGVTILEVFLAETDIPPELLVARKREQLAQQMRESFIQEEQSQLQRVETENARATADQQDSLVTAEIEVLKSEKLAIAAANLGKGEKDRLTEIAKGQKSQTDVLGVDRVVELRKFELTLEKVFKFASENPEVIASIAQNAHKFVPVTSINMTGGSDSNDLGGFASILGALLNPPEEIPTTGTSQPKSEKPNTN